jgi:hypothetical protein
MIPSIVKKLFTYGAEVIEQVDAATQIGAEKMFADLRMDQKHSDPRRLAHYEHTVFSQAGEDGILRELMRRVGSPDKTFVEFGVGNGSQNNTKFLLTTGWSGLWIESDAPRVKVISRVFSDAIAAGRLTLLHESATPATIVGFLRRANIPREFDVLSIDIDGDDYHVWAAIEDYRPRIVVIEYNSIFFPDAEWVKPYKAGWRWDRSRDFGASLKSLERLGERKGYRLTGCNLAGVNAFFVREDLVSEEFCGPFTAEHHYEPPRYFLAARRAGHRPSPADM